MDSFIAINALRNAILHVSAVAHTHCILLKQFIAAGIHCTLQDLHNNRCKIKFCTPCLKNRYGERLDEIKAAVKMQDDPAHIRHETYVWK